MANVDVNIEKWKKRLLDLGKKNRLINYRETKRSNIKITSPNSAELYSKLVINEKVLTFAHSNQNDFDDADSLRGGFVYRGDIETDRSLSEQQKTLANLRSKARLAAEEQGVNILYLSVGFLKWKESKDSDQILLSPIILIPVTLSLESITSPFVLSLHEDEIVINPTLLHKLENDFGIVIPDFDSNEGDIVSFFSEMRKIVNKNGWDISLDVGLSLFSFLKINMYRDLEENKAKIASNMIVRALSGDKSGIITLSSEFDNFEHDEKTKPIDTYQVLDADSSQQDAILYSKKGVSFVLQGPPGTGKSQTITNIISESLADGKKVLFVSEKMAALEVVHKRLSQVGLSNFCLNLHSYKANKKEILSELNQTLNLSKFKLQDDIPFRLESLKTARDTLNKYNSELHTNVDPLGSSIYEVNGKIAKLNSITDIIFKLNNVGETSPEKLIKYKSLLANFAGTIGKMSEDYETNPWRSSNVSNVTHELRHDIETNLKNLLPGLKVLNDCVSKYVEKLELDQIISMQYSENLITILEVASKSPTIPISWVLKDDIARLTARAEKYKIYKAEHQNLVKELSSKYSEDFFSLMASDIRSKITTLLQKAKTTLNTTEFQTNADITGNLKATIANLQKLSVEIASLQEVCKKSAGLLSGKPVENINQAIELTDFLSHLLANSKPTKEWFDAEKLKIVKRLFSEIKNKYEEIEKEEKPILSGFEKEIFDLDFLPMLKRFKVDYSSPFKIINKNYWNDKKVIQSLLKDSSKKIADNTILILLRNG